jgi:hypothetical protein
MCRWLKAKLEERVVAGVSCGKKEKKLAEEREREREREEVVVAALPLMRSWVGGDGGGQAGGKCGGGRRLR